MPDTINKIGDNVFSQRYIVQPDRRYNPWSAYKNLPITLKCIPGSYAQEYAREHGLKLEKCNDKYNEMPYQNAPTYVIRYDSYKKEPDKEVRDEIRKFIKQFEDCEYTIINKNSFVFRTEVLGVKQLFDKTYPITSHFRLVVL